MSAVIPTEIKLHKVSGILELIYPDGRVHKLSAEFLRVHSPSAEVQGHGAGQEILQVEKEDVQILGIEPVGSYAVKLVFSDGHDTGLYSWEYLYRIGADHTKLWEDYLRRLQAAGYTHASRRQDAKPSKDNGRASPNTQSGWKQL